ncbi:MAG: zinc-binding alcohol dehydrogenase family protein [Rhodocyclaceae bacterium]|jgi:zinc-binding alcohol dehydrogenase family protein|nr:zinc-binding alcohol dehydrogenase family protein [Rhodocyclaceae bacterium]
MKAVGYRNNGAIHRDDALLDLELPRPTPTGRDLLVEVQAVSVNPVDTKVRKAAAPEAGQVRVLGFDAVGIVRETGPDASLFKVGDAVWYAGAIDRPGSNSEFQLVDERIVGLKPKSLAPADAVALPLTAITAWELLFDRLQIPRRDSGAPASLLVVGAAGGVGSILVQLARQLTGLTVIGTASRPESRDWVKQMGAHHVIDHRQPLAAQIAALDIPPVMYVASLTHTEQHYAQIVELLAPQGKLALIDDPAEIIDIRLLKRKSISLHWELMFTRSLFQTTDMIAQHALLNEVSALVDQGRIRSTAQQHLGAINATNLKQAHRMIESASSIGKIVLAGF